MDDEPEPEPEPQPQPESQPNVELTIAPPVILGPELSSLASLDSLGAATARAGDAASEGSSYGDMEDFEDLSLMEDDEASLVAPPPPVMHASEPNDNIQRTRTYDLDVTYDKYYQTPRVWLFGYDEALQPLGPDQIFEDISQDHANRTVTFETHPHKNIQYATVHPCRHAVTMKKIMAQLVEGGKTLAVDHYLFLFLKFIASVIPTMEYDFTLPADFG